jgi:hypothetical protein
MTPSRVYFTGLEFDPASVLQDRCLRGVIPSDWPRHRFAIDRSATFPVGKLSRWCGQNIEGRWAVYCSFSDNERLVSMAFENEFDAMTFLMADGKTEAFREPDS